MEVGGPQGVWGDRRIRHDDSHVAVCLSDPSIYLSDPPICPARFILKLFYSFSNLFILQFIHFTSRILIPQSTLDRKALRERGIGKLFLYPIGPLVVTKTPVDTYPGPL